MSFPRKLLTANEDVLFELHPHWKVLVRPVLLGVLALAAGLAGTVVINAEMPARVLPLLAGILLALSSLVPPALRRRFTLFVLTNERLITRTGIVAKRSKEIPLETLNDISFSQGLLDRLLGAGDLVLESAGEHGQEVIGDVRRPESVQKRIYEAAELRKGVGRHPGPVSVADELAKLADLRDRGALTPDEFEARKRALLHGP